MDDHAYSARLHNTAMAAEGFVSLLVRLEHIIEHNVSFPSIVETNGSLPNALLPSQSQRPVLGLRKRKQPKW